MLLRVTEDQAAVAHHTRSMFMQEPLHPDKVTPVVLVQQLALHMAPVAVEAQVE
jgi:hypothetical protein